MQKSAWAHSKTALVSALILSLGCLSVYSGLLAYESFSYTNDHNYYKDGGFGWGSAWGGLSVTDGLTYTNSNRPLATQGAAAMLLSASWRLLDTTPSGPFTSLIDGNGLIGKEGTAVWISYLLRPIELNQFVAGVWMGRDTPNNGFALYLTNGITQLAQGVPFSLLTNYFVVERIQFRANNNDLREQYFNPVPGTPTPFGAQGTNVFTGDMRFNTVYLVGNSVRSPAGIVDELRFGQSYADVAVLPQVRLTDLHYSTGYLAFRFQTLASLQYILEMRPGVNNGAWSELTNFSGDGSVIEVTVPTTNSEARFFRVRTD